MFWRALLKSGSNRIRWTAHRGTSFISKRTLLTVSSVDGPLEPPLSILTLPEYFHSQILSRYDSRPALTCRQESPRPHGGPKSHNLGKSQFLAWDFAELHRHVEALARGLISLGITPGTRVGVMMGNNSAYALLQWACARIGAILVTINPAYRTNELIETLKLVGVSTLFIVPSLRSSNYVSMLLDVIPSLGGKSREISLPALPDLRSIVLVDNASMNGGFNAASDRMPCAIDFREIFVWNEHSELDSRIKHISSGLSKDDVFNLQFTSGTTGAPKAVSLTTYNLLNNALSIGNCMRFTPDDVLCNVPPLFHCFGLVLGNLAAWVHGSSVIYPSEIYDAPAIVDALVEEKCTALHGVPTHFFGVLEEVARRGNVELPHLRTGIAAGSPIPESLMRKLLDKLNLRELTIAYGMTETSPVSFQSSVSDPVEKRVETVGRIQPHVKAKIIDTKGSTVPIGTPGELCVAGYLVQKGYWNDLEQSSAVMKTHPGSSDLWMHTGDETVMDEQGYLRVISRIKDIIIRGGENLFPVQIENVITKHKAIREAAVIAVPDDRLGEVVGVWIDRTVGEKPITGGEVRNWVATQMNPQNAPLWVWFLGEEGVETELPKTASGKVQKHILRDRAKRWSKIGIGKVSSPKPV